MAKHATMQIRIDEDLEEQADRLFEALGLSPLRGRAPLRGPIGYRAAAPFTPHLSKSEGGRRLSASCAITPTPPYGRRARHGSKAGENTGDARFRTTTVADPTTTIVDETVLLHYLLDDEPRPSTKARRLIASGCAQAYPETAALTVQLLEEDYRVPRSLIGTVMELLADDVSFKTALPSDWPRVFTPATASRSPPLPPIAARNADGLSGGETFNKQLSNITR